MKIELVKELLGQVEERLKTGEEPPWSWFQLMKLKETLQQVLQSMDATTRQTENLPQSDLHLETPLRLVDSKYLLDAAQRHRDTSDPILPM